MTPTSKKANLPDLQYYDDDAVCKPTALAAGGVWASKQKEGILSICSACFSAEDNIAGHLYVKHKDSFKALSKHLGVDLNLPTKQQPQALMKAIGQVYEEIWGGGQGPLLVGEKVAAAIKARTNDMTPVGGVTLHEGAKCIVVLSDGSVCGHISISKKASATHSRDTHGKAVSPSMVKCLVQNVSRSVSGGHVNIEVNGCSVSLSFSFFFFSFFFPIKIPSIPTS